MTKDTIFIKDNFIHFGKIEMVSPLIVDKNDNAPKLEKIDIRKVKRILINQPKNKITIHYNKDDETLIPVEIDQDIFDFEAGILLNYPNSIWLEPNQIHFQLIKKPLIAVIVILGAFFLTLASNPASISSSSSFSRPLTDLFLGLGSLGIAKVLLIFGSLIIFPIVSIFIKLKYARETQIIKIILND